MVELPPVAPKLDAGVLRHCLLIAARVLEQVAVRGPSRKLYETLASLAETFLATTAVRPESALHAWAEDIGRLNHLAEAMRESAPQESRALYAFIRQQLTHWHALHARSLEGREAAAREVLLLIRGELARRWPQHFSPGSPFTAVPAETRATSSTPVAWSYQVDGQGYPSLVTAEPGATSPEPNRERPDDDIIADFAGDVVDQLEILEGAVLAMEQAASSEADYADDLTSSRRSLHTLKGCAYSLELERFAEGLHQAEEPLKRCNPRHSPPKELLTFLLHASDQIRGYLAALRRDWQTPWHHDWSEPLELIHRRLDECAMSALAAGSETARH